ncbi:MAG: hypothetical protein M3X11_24095 [Acidobacteriota bacterium]|nr:hypothetical protein [Acidobacteriota bacterium]
MKKEIDFSGGVRGKYAGQRLRIVGDPKARLQKPGDRCYLVILPGGVEFDVHASSKVAARQAATDYFGRGRLPKGTKIVPAVKPAVESAQVTALGDLDVIVLPKTILRKLNVQSGQPLYFVETHNGVELTSESAMPEALKKSA